MRAAVLFAAAFVVILARARDVRPAAPQDMDALAELVDAVRGPPALAHALRPGLILKKSISAFPAQTLDDLIDFLALPSTARALANVTLPSPPFDRQERCEEVIGANLTSRVVDCFCEDAMPWMTCDAWMHLELKAAWMAVSARVSARVSSRPGVRRGLSSSFMGVTCGGLEDLADLGDVVDSGGCVDTYCEADLFGFGRLYGQVSGCPTTVTFPDHGDELSVDDTCQVCTDGTCEDWTVYYLSWPLYSEHLLDSSIDGEIGACLELFGLQDKLEDLGFDGVLCETMTGTWWTLKNQVTLPSVRFTYGLKRIAGVFLELGGTLQISDGPSNPLCSRLSPFNDWWLSQDFCCWYAGDGRLTVTVGWDVLFFGDSYSLFSIDTASCE